MSENEHSGATTLAHTVGGRPVYRRDLPRPDGRYTYLYGYRPNTADVVPEEPSEVAKGGELRFHPLLGEWNVYAPHRQNRTFKPSAADNPLAPSIPGLPPTDIPVTDFELAVFENKFTSLHMEAPDPGAPDHVEAARARGRCDVVVYTPEDHGNLWSVGQDKRRLLLAAWLDRYATLQSEGHAFVMPFESRGEEVGVTLSHPHGQIYSFPHVPQRQQRAGEAFRAGYDLAADLDRMRETYDVAEVGGVRAWCPPYARYPFETWVVPTRKVAGPWDMSEEEQDGFMHLLGDVTRRMDAYFGRDTAYMLSLQAAPKVYEADWHFSAQFFPLLRAPTPDGKGRVKYLASVEQHTQVFTVDVMPEFAAEQLRQQTLETGA